MKRSHTLIILMCASLALWCVVELENLSYQPRKIQSDQTILAEKVFDPGIPVHLSIPSIGIDANVETVGIASDGTMGVPKKPEPVGWLSMTAHPGATGTSIIDGHSGWVHKRPAAFDNLKNLKVG